MSPEDQPVFEEFLADHLEAEWKRQTEITESPISDLYLDEVEELGEVRDLLPRFEPYSADYDETMADINHRRDRVELLVRFHDIVEIAKKVGPRDPMTEDPVCCAMSFTCLILAAGESTRGTEQTNDLRWLAIEAHQAYQLDTL